MNHFKKNTTSLRHSLLILLGFLLLSGAPALVHAGFDTSTVITIPNIPACLANAQDELNSCTNAGYSQEGCHELYIEMTDACYDGTGIGL